MTSQLGEPALRPPDGLSKYHILRRLGSGGMAEIYLARALGIEGFEKHVVLKKILPEHSRNPTFVRMFLDEARLAATLQHQNIAQVYDIGRIADGYFFVMEFLHGRDLRSIKREHRKRATRLPLHHALTIAAGAAAGLDYAHNATDKRGRALSLVHRDVSPSNIVVTFDGAVKLLDFGIARAGDKPSETKAGALKGKVPYMSPEQCRGLELDARSDLFSLGVTLYELATGESPFCHPGDTDFLILEKICAGRYTKPSTVVSSLPDELEKILIRALATDRTERYGSAREMLTDIEQAAADLGVPLSATALADHLRTIYGEQPMPWADELLDGVEEDVDDELLRKTIATGSVVEGVTLYQITPNTPNTPSELAGDGVGAKTSLKRGRRGMWLAAAALVAVGGVVLAFSAMGPSGPAESAAKSAPKEDIVPATEAAAQPTLEPTPSQPTPGIENETKPVVTEPSAEGEVKPIKSKAEPRRRRAQNSRSRKRSSSKTSAESDGNGSTKADPAPKKPTGLLDRKW